jgi:hypothetical protein
MQLVLMLALAECVYAKSSGSTVYLVVANKTVTELSQSRSMNFSSVYTHYYNSGCVRFTQDVNKCKVWPLLLATGSLFRTCEV